MQTDNAGRPVAADGWPVAGLAKVDEARLFLGLSRSKVYGLLQSGALQSQTFGKSRRIRWTELRRVAGEVVQQ
jgi:excisionase family DNA binding protein